jgi:hypothetical protein
MKIVQTISQTIKIKNHTLEQVMEHLEACGLTAEEIVSIKVVD